MFNDQADACNVEVDAALPEESSAVGAKGAAAIAFNSLGSTCSESPATSTEQANAQGGTIYSCNPSQSERLEPKYLVWKQLYPALKAAGAFGK